MIIKSMSRKSASFNQLIDYITTGQIDEKYNVFQNVYQRNYEQLKREFEVNARRLAQRKNGVYLYHEILSITRAQGISEQRQKEIFCQLAQAYAQGRAGQNMVYAGMHDDKAHNLHYHFVISANGVNDSKRLRLSKAEFSKFKTDFEQMVLQQYPELEQGVIIQRTAKTKLSKKGGELKRRTGKVPERERVTEILNKAFEQSFSHDAFISELDKAGFNFYIRGKKPGVEDRATGRKYRLATLGLIDQLEALDDAVQTARSKTKPERKSERKTEQKKHKTTQVHEDTVKSTNQEKIGEVLSDEERIARERAEEMKQKRQADSKQEGRDSHKR